jgi:hypothetical protein
VIGHRQPVIKIFEQKNEKILIHFRALFYQLVAPKRILQSDSNWPLKKGKASAYIKT